MSNIITAKIDVTLIDKARLFPGKKANKAGKMPQYLDVVLIPSSNSQFGDTHMIVQSVTKEEREAGTKGAILGNAKEKASEGYQSDAPQERHTPPPRSTRPTPPSDEYTDEDVPF